MSIMVQVSELSFATAEGRMVLDNVHLSLARGDFIFLVGPAGSGKTTLLKLLCHELTPQRGQILVDDRNITRLSKGKILQLRQRLGIVPQNPKPLTRRTVYENLIFKLRSLGFSREEAARKALEALDLVGLVQVRDLSFKELAEPEKRIVHIALAISNDPVLLLCDEPFASLKAAEALTVLEALKRVHERERMTILVATSEAALARSSGAKTYFLQNGTISAQKEERG